MGHYMDTLRVAGENAMPRPVTTVWPDQSELIAEEVNAAVSGDKSPEDAATDLQDGLEDTEASMATDDRTAGPPADRIDRGRSSRSRAGWRTSGRRGSPTCC